MSKRRVIQRHHITRDPEIIRHIFRFEHEILSKLGWLLKSTPSWTFLHQLDEIRRKFTLKAEALESRPYTEGQMEQMYLENQQRRKAK